MSGALLAEPLTAQAFAPFGDVIETDGAPDMLINQGLCGRFHDRARLDFSDGRAGLSLFDAEARRWPCRIAMMERHPLGSQAFVPLDGVAMLVSVALDDGGRPGAPRAFLSRPGQVVNLLRGTWHGVLAPIGARGRFAVIDRIGPGDNLEEYWFKTPLTVEGPQP
ncbi:MAG: ureidoglycolate lyase [Pseudomonadota bacterium]|uniref:ureidoglycolate lyase n=1 Tax=Roseovarius salincola TaxID=2978479 RepID=UPI0022A70940|nr:ureidoglycolate lyase [Roseovarius sp. EGI FJ00037]MCZ0811621.1 ureidoglycolate lyase [Roseovarius sp. EGI FJ00037]